MGHGNIEQEAWSSYGPSLLARLADCSPGGSRDAKAMARGNGYMSKQYTMSRSHDERPWQEELLSLQTQKCILAAAICAYSVAFELTFHAFVLMLLMVD